MVFKEKIVHLVVVAVLILVFTTPLTLFALGYRNTETIDNRPLVSFPEFEAASVVDTGFYKKLTTYFVDRFPKRPQIVRQRGVLLQNHFHDFSNSRIVWGRDNWMFLREAIHFSCDDPGKILKSVRGMLKFTAYARSIGKDVAFMIAPNKATIYPDMVTRRFKPYIACENRHRNAFHRMVRRQGDKLNYLDVFAPTRAARKRWPQGVYHWFDVHWDCRGTSILGDLILRDYFNDKSLETPLRYIPERRTADISIVLGRPFRVEWMSCRSSRTDVATDRIDDKKDRYFSAYSANAARAGRILLIHDSFANGLRRLMPHVVSQWTMYNVNNRDFGKLATAMKESDKIYVEIVERSAYANFARLGHPRFLKLLKRAMNEGS